MDIIFMGTPDFSLPALQGLIDSKNHNVVAVFSQAPKSKDRGMKISESPVHKLANTYNIPVYTPRTLKNEESLRLVQEINADIIVVVAYGFIIPASFLTIKKYGCLNIHPSKLPKYRGAAPLQRTIINGDDETAVCIMQMDEALDTGDIILQENFTISPSMNLKELHDKCANMGCDLLLQVLDNITTLPRIKQSSEGATYAHKLTKKESKVNWQNSAHLIDCQIRGMNPWPGTFCQINGNIVKIIEARYDLGKHNYTPGQLLNKDFDVACKEGILYVKKVQPAGKNAMSATDYLRGLFNLRNFDFLKSKIILN